MTIKIYNSLSRQKQDFIPVENGKVKMYVCGMTVYSDAHIGHARTYFAFDVIRRYFEYKGYKVTYVQNITDVDDKIIAAANKEGVDALEYSKRFADRCLGDLDNLGIRRADIYPKASETIPEMIEMTQQIVDNGYGYEVGGDVYFSVEKFKDYGKLSGQKLDEMKVSTCALTDEKKYNPFDFALWKSAKPGEPSWDSPWGKGRPGWHIECSAMSKKYLGLPFDIHGGGMDLRFPHHENEIAQAEAADGKGFANYWMHIGLLTVNGEKMSKSLGNMINVKDLIEKWSPEIVRFFFAQAHYRSPPDFSEIALENAKKGLDKIHRLKEKLDDLSVNGKDDLDENNLTENEKCYLQIIKDFKLTFEESMDDDINTPRAISAIFDFVNNSNKYLEENKKPDSTLCKYALDTLLKLGSVLTLFQDRKIGDEGAEEILDKVRSLASKHSRDIEGKSLEELMDYLLDIREKAREEKEWNIADSIRSGLSKIGFEIQDTSEGAVWRKK
ncbi:MAG: cysteine--tRNA ligase [Candidatus Thermoplasmatota archaeon]|nr:cysteine--tRNA ligase [Candidatus Thermoplasmatota archaeon]